jgi:TonB family protein
MICFDYESDMKKTLILSIVLHIILFSAALLFSAGLIKGSRNVPLDYALMVRLEEDEVVTAPEGVLSVKGPLKSQEVPDTQKGSKLVEIVSEKSALIKARLKTKKTDTLTIEAEVSERSRLPENKTMHEQLLQTDVSAAQTGEMSERIKGYDKHVVSFPAENLDAGDVIMASAPASAWAEGVLQIPGKTEGTVDPGTMEIIFRAIERAKTYPLIARKRGMEGTVYVRFSINPEGEPWEIEILKSSGFRILDRATVNIVQLAGPYPHISRRIEVPVAYTLKD